MKILKETKGITLIALVITIIVLLILAAVSIATLTGQNGILTKADTAKTKTVEEQEKEEIKTAYAAAVTEKLSKGDSSNVTTSELNTELGNQNTQATAADGATEGNIDVTFRETNHKYTVHQSGDKKGTITGPEEIAPPMSMEEAKKKEKFDTKTEVKAADDKIFTIPAEFKIATDSADRVEDGVVIEDARDGLTKGSQFVWIPVESEEDYVHNASYENTFYSGLDYEDGEILKENVLNAGGFYISRFEAGKEGDNILVSKSGATVWNNILQDKCIEESEKFINNADVKSSIISAVQWDVVMSFIDGKPCEKGTFNVTVVESSRHTGEPAESGKNIDDKVCNIFDLEGNYEEYCVNGGPNGGYSEGRPSQVCRGGNYDYQFPASYYNVNVEDLDDGEFLNKLSFRFILYII